jgi:hypothetical protein
VLDELNYKCDREERTRTACGLRHTYTALRESRGNVEDCQHTELEASTTLAETQILLAIEPIFLRDVSINLNDEGPARMLLTEERSLRKRAA